MTPEISYNLSCEQRTSDGVYFHVIDACVSVRPRWQIENLADTYIVEIFGRASVSGPYCSIVWGNCHIGLSEKFQKLWNRAARVLVCADCDSNIDEYLRALGWRKLR